MSDKWEAIVIKLFLGVGGYLMLGSSIGWTEAGGFVCLLAAFTYEIRRM
jgi:hypothetical protein